MHITQAATEATVTAANPLATSTVIDSSNNTLSFKINGSSSGTITLASGTYSADDLATEVQKEINSVVSASGSSVTVSVSNNGLSIASNRYGSKSSLGSLSGTALSTLGFTGSETSTGQDVQGSYVVNGVTETATGNGQILTGSSSNANTAGLVIVVGLTAAQVAPGGTDSTLTVTQGLGSSLSNSLSSLLDPTSGLITTLSNQITKSIADAQADVTTQTTAMNTQQAALMSQFAALETVMSNMQQTANLLTSALANGSSSGSSSSKSSSSSSSGVNFANASIASSSS